MKNTTFILFICLLTGCAIKSSSSGIELISVHKNGSCLFFIPASNTNRYYIIDTGSKFSILNSQYVDEMSGGDNRVYVKTPFGRKKIGKIKIDHINMDKLDINFNSPAEIGIANLKSLEKRLNFNIEGVLGRDVLGEMAFVFDKSQDVAKIYPNGIGDEFNDSLFDSYKIDDKGRINSVKVNEIIIDGVVLDTGATTSGLSENVFKSLSSHCEKNSSSSSILGGKKSSEILICKSVTINGHSFKDFQFDNERFNTLGTNFFCSSDFLIDYRNNKFYLAK